jgi:hypothetical protein
VRRRALAVLSLVAWRRARAGCPFILQEDRARRPAGKASNAELAFWRRAAIIEEPNGWSPGRWRKQIEAFASGRKLQERVMVHTEFRVVFATIAIFVALLGIGLVIHGLLFDRNAAMWSGMISIAAGMAGCVVMLTLWPRDNEDSHP